MMWRTALPGCVQVVHGVPKSRLCNTSALCLPRGTTEDSALKTVDIARFRAEQRLRELLSTAQGSKELLDRMLEDIPPKEQLILFSQISGILAVVSATFSALCGTDPLGGFDIFSPSLGSHCLCGIGAATPLLLIKWLVQTDHVPRFVQEFPVKARESRQFLFKALPLREALVAMALVSAGTSFLVYSGLIGNLASSMQTYLSSSTGMDDPGAYFVWALLIVSAGIGFLEGGNLALLPEEIEAVLSAVQNSDRYYQLTTPKESGPSAARIHSNAFRRASWELIRTSAQTSIFGGAMSALETVYGGVLWRMTGDISTTICLFLCVEIAGKLYEETESGSV